MLRKVIKYTDYNGNEREETFLFNLDESELMEMELIKLEEQTFMILIRQTSFILKYL
jgi:hypothetical protein